MTAATPPGPRDWLEELEALLPEARRGFMEDRAPEAAGFLIDALPALVGALRAVLDLADRLDLEAQDDDATQAVAKWDTADHIRAALAAVRRDGVMGDG